MSLKEAASYGGEELVIRGKYLGDRADQTPVAYVGETPCRETIWRSKEEVVCVTPHSPAGRHLVTVSIGATTSKIVTTSPRLVVIDPTVTSIDRMKGGASGGENLTITGVYLGGKAKHAVVAVVGGTPCARTYKVSATEVVCTTPARFTGDARALVSVSVDGHRENATMIGGKRQLSITYLYKILRVTLLVPGEGVGEGEGATHATHSTGGNYEVVFRGESFGATSVAYIGERRCLETRPSSDHLSLVCVVPPGTGANHLVEVRVRQNISSLVAGGGVTFSYSPPRIDSLSPSRGAKTGGTLVNVTGGNFGPSSQPLIVYVGGQAALDVVHLSHTSLSFVTPDGVGEEEVTIEVGNQTSRDGEKEKKKESSFVYIPAQITSFAPNTGSTEGGWVLEIRGIGFGLNTSELAAANLSSTEELAEVASEEVALARKEEREELNAVAASDQEMEVEESEEKAARQQLVKSETKKAGEEERLEIANEKRVASEERKEEDEETKLLGEAEAAEKKSKNTREKKAEAALNAERKMLAKSAGVLEQETMENKKSEAEEESREHQLASEASTSESDELSEQELSEQAAGSDDDAPAAPTPPPSSSSSSSALAALPDNLDDLAKRSEARFREISRVNEISTGLASAVTTARSVAAKSSEYQPASVVLSRDNAQTQYIMGDSSLLEIHAEKDRRRERAKAASQLVAWAKKIHDETNPYEKFSTTVEPRFRSLSSGFASGAKRSSSSRAAITRSSRSTFSGSGVWINGVKCGNVTWWSDSRVTCIVPPGVGGHLSVRVLSPTDNGLAAEIQNNATTFLSYDLPIVDTINHDFGRHGTVIDANVTNLGPMGMEISAGRNGGAIVAYVGERPCARTTRTSATGLRCVVPKGAGKNLVVSVLVGGQRGSEGATYSYPPPQVLKTFPVNGHGRGGNVVTILGRNFGDAASLGPVTIGRIGKRECLNTTIVSDTLIRCVAPPGVGRDLHVTVTSNNQESVTPVRRAHGNGTEIVRLVTTSQRELQYEGEGAANLIGNVTSNSIEGRADVNFNATAAGAGSGAGVNSSNGTAANATLRVRVVAASTEALYSYPTPTITKMIPDTVSGKGGDVVTIIGESFGESGEEVDVLIGGKKCTDVVVVSTEMLTCVTPPGKGDAIPVSVVTGGQPSEIYDWFEYDGPRVWTNQPRRVQKEEDEKTTIEFEGIHLGLDEDGQHVQGVTVGGYPCGEPTRISGQKWTCVIEERGRMGHDTPVQIHLPHRHRFSPSNNTNGFNGSFTFKAEPEMMRSTPLLGPKEGGTEVVVEGIFGPEPPSSVEIFVVGVERMPCASSTWLSPTSIGCVMPKGRGHVELVARINGATALLSRKAMGVPVTFDYDPPIVRDVVPASGSTLGGELLTIEGVFDGPVTVTMRGLPCEVKRSGGEVVQCLTPPGVGANAPLHVISIDGARSPPFPFKYDAPVVVASGPDDLPPAMDDGRRMWVSVENVGPPGKEGELAKHVAIVLSDSPLKSGEEAGVAGEMGVAAVVVETASNVSDASGASDASVNATATTNGTAASEDSKESGGGELCDDVRWGKGGEQTLTCVPSAGFGYRSLVVVVAGQKSALSNMSYAPATVSAIRPVSADPGTVVRMEIEGTGFLSAPLEVLSAHVGKQECVALSVVDDNHLQCNITTRPGGHKAVNVQIAALQSPPGIEFTATPPLVKAVEPNVCKLTGGCLLTIQGNHFFPNLLTAVSLGDLACEQVQVVSKTSLTCIAPRGTPGTKIVVVDVAGARNDREMDLRSQEESPLFTYPSSSITRVRPTHGSKQGGTTIVIEGAGFGEELPRPGTLNAMVGGAKCTSTRWISDTKLECVTPPEVRR